MNRYENQSVAVFGLGITGLSVINFLLKSNVQTYAWDDNEDRISNAKTIYQECTLIHPDKYNWQEIKTLILSPGVPFSSPSPHWIVKLAKRFGCVIKSDIDLFLEAKKPEQKIVGVTGTNGKSTTTSLIGHILKSAGRKVDIGGNLGVAVFEMDKNAEIYVIELSSFQLDLMNEVKVDIAVLLNITPDHIDRHGSMENYIKIKSKLMNGSDVAIIGCENDITSRLYDEFTGHKIPILVSSSPIDCFDEDTQRDAKINLISNAENIAAASLVCNTLEVDWDSIVDGVKSFPGLKHRNEPVGKISNVFFVNDSKATNAESSRIAIVSYNNIYWIVGGRSKQGGIESLKEHFTNIRKAFLIGESTEAFAKTMDESNVEFVECGHLESAFKLAFKEAMNSKEEVTVLLSPACASFDQWKNFEERGDAFCRMFEDLKLNYYNTK